MFAERQLNYVDCGTSGGVWGLAEGYSMMIGGEASVVERLRPIFETLAPAPNRGWGRVGPSGAGHFTKMIHNGIEYGLMQAYAEGFSIMQHKTEFGLDLHQVAEIWRDGSVVRSWLLDLTAIALKENPALDGIAPFVRRLGRRAMDGGRGDRSERARAGDHAGAAGTPARRAIRIHSRQRCCRRCATSSAGTTSRSSERETLGNVTGHSGSIQLRPGESDMAVGAQQIERRLRDVLPCEFLVVGRVARHGMDAQ